MHRGGDRVDSDATAPAFLAGVVVSVGAMRLTSVRTASIVLVILHVRTRPNVPAERSGRRLKRKEAAPTYEKLAEQAAKNEEQKQLKLKEEQRRSRQRQSRQAQAASYQDNVDFYRPVVL